MGISERFQARANDMKTHSRYPYTFACDWVRQTKIAESRADASTVITALAEYLGVERKEAAEMLANEYVETYVLREMADDFERGRLSTLKETLQNAIAKRPQNQSASD